MHLGRPFILEIVNPHKLMAKWVGFIWKICTRTFCTAIPLPKHCVPFVFTHTRTTLYTRNHTYARTQTCLQQCRTGFLPRNRGQAKTSSPAPGCCSWFAESKQVSCGHSHACTFTFTYPHTHLHMYTRSQIIHACGMLMNKHKPA